MSCLRLPYRAESALFIPSLLPYRHRYSRRLFGASCSATATSNKKQKIIVISGPTGAGKSRLALELAKRLNGEIISADSVQVYRGLDVGSAKPSPSERKEVPHHLIDILDPSEGSYMVSQMSQKPLRRSPLKSTRSLQILRELVTGMQLSRL